MCRALRRARMAARKDDADRPDGSKQALKPYRDNHVNRMRAVTGSARVNLNKRWKSLENVFADRDRSERAGDTAVNETRQPRSQEDGENADPTSDAVRQLRRMRVDR